MNTCLQIINQRRAKNEFDHAKTMTDFTLIEKELKIRE